MIADKSKYLLLAVPDADRLIALFVSIIGTKVWTLIELLHNPVYFVPCGSR
ncbi:hypothetical protein GCM10027098_14220 [Bowmanella dokdonensis]